MDLGEDISIPLNKQIADIRTPENRSSAYTKTITVPGTKSNNKLFGFVFDVSQSILNESDTTNFLPDFNPNLKADCRIYEGTNLQIQGYAQLLQVNIIDSRIEYEIAVFGELANLFTSIGSDKLQDLNFSQYNHTYNLSNIENSWSVNIKDSTQPGGVKAFQYGSGYVYPLIDYGFTDNFSIQREEYFRPAIYVKTIVDKIFSTYGFTYTPDSFFNDDVFKHLIIPYNGTGLKLSDADVINRYIEYTRTSTANLSIGNDVSFSTLVNDTYSQYNGTTLTVSKGGFYRIAGDITISNNSFSSGAPSEGYFFRLGFQVNGEIVYTAEVFAKGGAASVRTPYKSDSIKLVVGDSCKWIVQNVFDINADALVTGGTVALDGTFTLNADKEKVPLGDTINMNSILPKDILQKDFLTSITRMFNLYWDNTDINGELIIKPRDEYYTDNVNDYRNKLDISQPFNILPMGDLDANPYTFTYKEDKDFYNDMYFKEFQQVYGNQKYFINNDFIKDEKKTEVIFSATPLARELQWASDMTVSSIKYFDSKGELIESGGNIRILYYGGLKSTTTGLNVKGDSLTTIYSNYPYAGHLDDPLSSTLDLNFGTPKKLYYTRPDNATLTYTGNNLFAVYYSTMIDEITNKDSKIVKAYFRLRPKDVAQIDFSYLYYFKGQYFRLNRMIDHEIGGQTVTQMEFIKSRPALQFIPTPLGYGIGWMTIGTTNIVG